MELKLIKGVMTTREGMMMSGIIVRYSEDGNRKTLSISDSGEKVMFTIPFEEIEKVIKKEKRKKK